MDLTYKCISFNFYRTAKKKEIIKAYRKLAIKWHPDKYEGGDVETAKKMFHDIASAKEVLTNPGNTSIQNGSIDKTVLKDN